MASRLAPLLRSGDLLLLCGDLWGRQDRCSPRAWPAASGVERGVTSPTFTMAHRYDGRLPINHLDVYRIDRLREADDLAVPELLDDEAVTMIEWGEAIRRELPRDYLEVTVAYGEADDDRTITLQPVGRWTDRAESPAHRVRDLPRGRNRADPRHRYRDGPGGRRRRRSRGRAGLGAHRPADVAMPRRWHRRSTSCAGRPRSSCGSSARSASTWAPGSSPGSGSGSRPPRRSPSRCGCR